MAITPRQRDLLALIARGSTQSEAAAELGISYATARHHLNDAYDRLGVAGGPKNRSILDAFRALGWLRTGDVSE